MSALAGQPEVDGARARDRRILLGWQLDLLARQLGVDASMLADWEGDRARPTMQQAKRWASELGWLLNDLLVTSVHERREMDLRRPVRDGARR